MKRNSVLFLWAVIVGAMLTGGYFWLNQTSSVAMEARIHRLTNTVFVRDQISLAEVAAVRKSGYSTLINLRPDGEAPGQPSAARISAEAHGAGLEFLYIPVPHGPIPDEAVIALAAALEKSGKPVLLYCRSGSRAARAWALAEASRSGGMNAADIAKAARSAGFPVEDIKPMINARVASRPAK